MFAILLPVMLLMLGLIIDGSNLIAEHRNSQQAVDAAAVAAARSKYTSGSDTLARTAARQFVQQHNGLTDAGVTFNSPPLAGAYAGDANYVEVVVSQPVDTLLMDIAGHRSVHHVQSRAVAGFEPSTAGAALVVLDPDPPPLNVLGLPAILPPLPAIVGGLEVIGVGRLDVEGAVLVNTEWGGSDENGDPAGNAPPPPFAVTSNLGLPLQRIRAEDIRVVGGVDNPGNYAAINAGDPSPLRANMLPVPDPYRGLPAPTTANDPANVSNVVHGGVRVARLPLLPPVRLSPGVYDWIEIVLGRVEFEPGVYIIRGVNPITQIGLNVLGGNVRAEGVMFYLTNAGAYSPLTGAPDAADGETAPPAPPIAGLLPSAVINVGLLQSSFSPLDDPASPFDGLLIYQRRLDRRPIFVVAQNLIGAGSFGGSVYARWGHVTFIGQGDHEASFASGTLRVVNLGNVTLSPGRLLPPAQDVFLVE
jgi:hypothetical protein